ncbi:hypothetical protein LTR94_025936 [Friedmanniomyces endolithicus]|nr:hypothetical protein LTR94_025936 [Friedmanniomyces endolithicus]
MSSSAAPGFNPVGDMVAQAQSSLSPTEAADKGLAELGLASTGLTSTGLAPASAIGEVSVPRIAIHVFAERQDTLAAAERAAQDRRLSRATTQIRIGGVLAAVEAYHHEPTPPLIIVECLKDPQTLLWEVDQLAEVCDAGTKVIVVGPTNDILLFRELMRRGVSEYLVGPLQPLQLIAAIGGLLLSDAPSPLSARAAALASRFGDRVGLVHGRLRGAEKDAVMARFSAGETGVLVATTVIEVGVDVPNATLIVIEHADRFGLAQLHQLRGRVGRGGGRSVCLLLRGSALSETARARLALMRETNDGFRIAEEDLRLRGAGELLGTRQSGEAMFRLATPELLGELLPAATDDARLMIDRDGGLEGERGQAARVALYLFERDAGVALLRSG